MLDCALNVGNIQRLLLKLSGEQLSGKSSTGIDASLAAYLAKEINNVSSKGIQVIIMVGGGNFARGAQLTGDGVKRVTADHIGMLGTMMNALALTDIFESQNIPTRCLSSIFAQQVAEPFVHRLANKHLEKGRVVIVGGGLGRPYITTDTAAVDLGLELECELVAKATKVDGVYDKDPAKFPDAIRLTKLSYADAALDNSIKVMDKAGVALAMEHKLPIIVFDIMQSGNLLKIVEGENVGTKISD